MKRYGIFIILIIFITLLLAVLAGAAPTKVEVTKHNLQSTYTSSIRSDTVANGGTTEICVFCHTPHSGSKDAPLWNKKNPAGGYTMYNSDVMIALSYTPETDASLGGDTKLHVKTRICLSCHDGTIALGSLVNLPGGMTSDIPMVGTGGSSGMPTFAAGYIGTDLRDDHPVAIKYISATPDPELQSLTILGPIYLYNSSGDKTQSSNGSGYIECTTCHNAHDNQYGNFLVMSNQSSNLCRACHNKAGVDSTVAGESIHSNTNYFNDYAPTTGGTPSTLGTSVQTVKCMDCHFPHKAGVLDTNKTNPVPGQGKYLLSFNEEQSCFNANFDRWGTSGSADVCHGTTGVKNIATYIDQNYKHDVRGRSGRHRATEGRTSSPDANYPGWIHEGGSQAKWHVECEDCHNPHTAGAGVHSSPLASVVTLTAGSSLYGVSGVDVSFPGTNWSAPGSGAYSFIKSRGVTETTSLGVNMEYKICFKCHTLYAWSGGSIPTAASLGSAMTDQALEFNPNNLSSHPVVTANPSTLGTYVSPWTSGGQTMYCSDCHTKSGGGTPKGPHGSTNSAILIKPFTNSGQYGAMGGTSAGQQYSGDLCFDCHDANQYLRSSITSSVTGGTGFTQQTTNYNLHTQHQYREASSANTTTTIPNLRSYKCVNCHVRVPHGYDKKAMIVYRGDGAPYEAEGNNTGLVPSGTLLPSSGNYVISTCASTPANGITGCHY